MRKHCICLTYKEQTSKMIFRLVVPFANRLVNLRLADGVRRSEVLKNVKRSDGTFNDRDNYNYK